MHQWSENFDQTRSRSKKQQGVVVLVAAVMEVTVVVPAEGQRVLR